MTTPARFANLKTLFLVIAVVTIYRLLILHAAVQYIDLYADEAYYWGWAQHFDFGYYSKPPMVAWLIMLGTSLFGDTFFGIKVLSPIVYIFTTLNIFFLAKELFDDEEVAFWSGAAFITLPAVWLSSLIISTDVPFLFFWSLGMLFFVKALKSDRWRDWIVTGIAGGGGLLSKYTMIIFVVSAFGYLATSARFRHHLKNPRLYAAMGLAAMLYLPNLWWNANHQFVSFKHVSRDNAHITGIYFHVGKMFAFLGSQFGVFGPILFGWLLALLLRYRTLAKEEPMKLLWWFVVPMFALILTVSLLSRAFANWSAPMYVASTVLVTAWLLYRNRRKWLYAALAVNILLGVGLYHLHDIAKAAHIELTRKDPYKRVRGWKELGERVSVLMRRYPHAKLLSDDRKTMAELIFYVRPHPFDAVRWNPRHELRDQYELTTDMQKHLGEDFIFVTERPTIADVARRFEEARKLETIVIPLYKDYKMVYHVYYLKHFKGY
ncbi:glycosyltransferase family 39 protein [Hydrogenimonas sp. SS33]|uniref:ArnT family glycosyltransferase n=1 Tax=Hydrogenimonas leucolamina TaxID=2954236 RepID=UPI00336C18C3